jgi:hypothetical protein
LTLHLQTVSTGQSTYTVMNSHRRSRNQVSVSVSGGDMIVASSAFTFTFKYSSGYRSSMFSRLVNPFLSKNPAAFFLPQRGEILALENENLCCSCSRLWLWGIVQSHRASCIAHITTLSHMPVGRSVLSKGTFGSGAEPPLFVCVALPSS